MCVRGATGVQQAWEGVQRVCREGQEEDGVVARLRGASAERGLHRGQPRIAREEQHVGAQQAG